MRSATVTREVAWADRADELCAAVLVHLRASFGSRLSDADREDLAQEALVAMLRREHSGDEIRDPKAFAKRVAWRDARDLLQTRAATTPAPVDPQGLVVASLADRREDPESRVATQAELARALEAAEGLTPEQKLVYRSRFVEQEKPRDACRRLGLPRPTYYGRLKAAVARVEEALDPKRFAAAERGLIAALVAGTASAAEARRARRLIRCDPHAAATARELLELHRGTAAALPVPALEQLADPSPLERLAAGAASVRERVSGVGGETPEQLAAQVAGSGAGRGGGALAGGIVAHLGLAGGAGKIAVACLGTGAITAACVAGGLLPGGERDGQPEPEPRPEVVSKPTRPSPDLAVPKPTEEPDAPPAPEPSPPPEEPPSEPREPDEVLAPTTPAGEREFGVAASAPAPTSTSGSTASSNDVQREFGP